MQNILLKIVCYPYEISAVVTICGRDVVVCVAGGQKEHIGAAALAVSRKSLQDIDKISATASVLCLIGHKEDEPARKAALHLAASFNTHVLLVVGIHIEQATKKDLIVLNKNFDELILLVEERLKGQLIIGE